ncbi:MAG: Hpt domain-containing protein [Clostridium sp.]|nr:Hpt domain-containing protein [Roseburia sp.]MCM1500937.1 Hpt domain-containing protein [Clostridium sp.]
MDLKEFYVRVGGSYDSIMGRLMKEDRIKKYVYKFIDDTSYETLCRSMEENNIEEAFRAAHTIKGLCQNLDFLTLFQSSNNMSEALRNGKADNADSILEQVKKDYELTLTAIKELKAEEA